jgi:hypothetical protein
LILRPIAGGDVGQIVGHFVNAEVPKHPLANDHKDNENDAKDDKAIGEQPAERIDKLSIHFYVSFFSAKSAASMLGFGRVRTKNSCWQTEQLV